MGKRSRKRIVDPGSPSRPEAPAVAPPVPRTATWKADRSDAPQPPWAPFPLNELCILVAMVLLAVGFLTHSAQRPVFIVAGLVLVTLASGELALREHFAGYRSHTALLAGLSALMVGIPLWFTPVPTTALPVIGVLVFLAAATGLRRAFKARSGGVGFRA